MTIIENNPKLQIVPKLSAVIVKDKPNHVRHLTVGAIVGSVMCLFLYFLTADSHFPASLEAIFSISGISAYGVLLMSYWTESMTCRKNEYRKILNGYQQSELIKLSKSPELDETEQKLVFDFLNHTYPGWSLA